MKKLLASVLLGFTVICGNCGGSHSSIEFGKIIDTNGLISVQLKDGNVHRWYIEEDNSFVNGDKVVIIGCQLYKAEF